MDMYAENFFLVPVCSIFCCSPSKLHLHKTLFSFDSTDIEIQQRGGYTEFQFSDGGHDDVILVKALLRAGLLEADYYQSKNSVKNPTLEL